MNKRVREILKINKENRSIIHKYNLTIEYLEKFLNVSKDVFFLEKSVSSLDNIKKYLEELKNKLNEIYSEYESLDRELHSICSHDVLFSNYDQAVCPLCEYWFFKTKIPDGKYMIDKELRDSGKLIKEYIDFVINYSGNSFDMDVIDFLETLQDKYDVNILRR